MQYIFFVSYLVSRCPVIVPSAGCTPHDIHYWFATHFNQFISMNIWWHALLWEFFFVHWIWVNLLPTSSISTHTAHISKIDLKAHPIKSFILCDRTNMYDSSKSRPLLTMLMVIAKLMGLFFCQCVKIEVQFIKSIFDTVYHPSA